MKWIRMQKLNFCDLGLDFSFYINSDWMRKKYGWGLCQSAHPTTVWMGESMGLCQSAHPTMHGRKRVKYS